MTRVLFLGDMAGTGFGTVTKDLGKGLIELGDDLRFMSLNETPGNLEEPFASRTLLLGSPDGYMGDGQADKVLGAFTGDSWKDGWTPEAILILGDFAAVRIFPQIHPVITEALKRIPTFHYCPIEGVGLPPQWAALWQNIRPVAMSKFGAEQIAKITGSLPPVVYHGVNTDDFYPATPQRPIRIGNLVLRDRKACRKALGIEEDAIWLFRADRNMPRKTYAALLRSLAPVLARNPKVRLLLHCRTADEGGNLHDQRSKYPKDIASRIMFTGFHDTYGGAPRAALAALYNAADIYVSSSAEGFGLTIAEALACGTPAVGLNFSSVPEVIGPAGLTTPYFLIDNTYDHHWATPDEKAYGDAVEWMVQNTAERRLMGTQGPRHVRETFSWSTAARQFSGLFGEAVAVRSPDLSVIVSASESTLETGPAAGSGKDPAEKALATASLGRASGTSRSAPTVPHG